MALADGMRVRFAGGNGLPPMLRKEMYSQRTLASAAAIDPARRAQLMGRR